jgi:hypothetical protein
VAVGRLVTRKSNAVSASGLLPILALPRSSCVGCRDPARWSRMTWRLTTKELEQLDAALMALSSMDPTE